MKSMQRILLRLLSLSGFTLTIVQIIFHLRGQKLCFNDSCSLVEGYLNLDPLAVNTAGALFFLTIFVFSLFPRPGKGYTGLLLDLLITCGLVAEGLLVSIQIFIAHAFCSYCLIICTIILLTGLVYKLRIFGAGLILALVVIAFFSVIKLPFAGNVSLNSGTYAVKTCSSPVSTAYLIFSENCPHCRKVLNSLHGCVSCEIHFNPVSKIDKKLLPGLLPIEDYRPEINIMALKLFGINSVPVIIERTESGFGIIKGDRAILKYINEKCFCGRNKALLPAPAVGQDLLAPADDGVCSMEQECR